MIHLNHSSRLSQARLFSKLLHREDRAAGNVERIAGVHDLELGLGLGPFLDGVEDLADLVEPLRRRRVAGFFLPFRLADEIADRRPDRRLGDEVDIGVRIGFPALAFEDPAGLAAARVVAGARHRLAEGNVLTELRILVEGPVLQALLVAQLDAAEVQHTVLHGGKHLLAAPRLFTLVERGDNAESQMQPGAGIADLGAGYPRVRRRRRSTVSTLTRTCRFQWTATIRG